MNKDLELVYFKKQKHTKDRQKIFTSIHKYIKPWTISHDQKRDTTIYLQTHVNDAIIKMGSLLKH